jgi:predicted nucleic acid-binding protein
MRFLLDTNVISEVGKPRPNSRVLNWLLEHEAASGVPSVALAERYQGAHSVASAARRNELLAELDALVAEAPERIVVFDAAAARVWGEYVDRPALRRKIRSYPDTQIAAIALAHGLTVVTRNTDDFPEVATLNPWDD